MAMIKLHERRSFHKTILIYIALIIFTVVSVFSRASVLQPVKVSGASMEPTIHDKQLLIATSMLKQNISHGSVVVIKSPIDPSEYFIKRVIAIGGDSFYYKNGVLMLNGEQYPEPYLDHFQGNFPQVNFDKLYKEGIVQKAVYDIETGHRRVPNGYIFVLGDNRNISYDSDEFGLVSIDDVVSVVIE